MTPRAEGTSQVTAWDEQPHQDLDGGARLGLTRFGQAFSGGIEGTGTAETLSYTRADGTMSYVGLTVLRGTIDGRSGSFVLRGIGAFDGSNARGEITVVPGSGTGELAGLTGSGTVHTEGPKAWYALDYDLG